MSEQSPTDNLGDLSTKRVFTTGEAAAICKVSQQTIIRCFDAGRLIGFRVPGSKFRRIPRDELLRFMRSNSIPTDVMEGIKRRVLVVDDDEAILEMFKEVFERDTRFEVKTASTGYDAGLATELFKPHLIVLDYMLPDINGNMVCKRLRADQRYNDCKILCVSGVVNQAEIQGLLDAGANDFLKKPFDLGTLMQRVETLLEMNAAEGQRA